ncbi:hypothetical protein CDAR_583441 [Caerostris darwini]|uniref:Uncharacterized protein n=1 Tax=Caerostris darwini TaxID=1538125 RepID=A0AAV4PTB1_9ARAC|nr:hypothetical protein CDAR_583441 [Caerostris darwini]
MLNAVDRNLGTSVYAPAAATIASASTMWLVLHSEGLILFILSPCTAGDDVLPLQSGFFKSNLSDKHFPFSILFTNEISFTREEVFNTHNTKAWAVDNTYGARTGTAQHCFIVNV